MQYAETLLSSVDDSWNQFLENWNKARAKSSEKSVHDLRVSTRRLIAILELTRAVSRNQNIVHLQRQFKKVLKRMGPLRDVQVQLETISTFRATEPIKDFKRALMRLERREIEDIRKDLKRRRGRRLSDEMTDLRAGLEGRREALDDARLGRSIERLLRMRRNEYVKARRAFTPENEDTLHPMRIALKKFRYVVEAAQPVLSDWAKERVSQMHACQTLMGDTRDSQVLQARLEKWAAKRGKRVAVAPVLETLQRRRERLLKRIMRFAAPLDEIFPKQDIKPTAETTQAVSAPASEKTVA